MRIPPAILALCSWVLATQVAPAQVRPGRGPLIGYVHEGACYAATDANPADYGCTIFVGPLAKCDAPKAYYYSAFKEFTFPYRWRIAFGHFWARSLGVDETKSLERMPLADLDLFDTADLDEVRARFSKRYPWDTHLTHHGLELMPIAQLARDVRFKNTPLEPDRLVTEAYFDFLPTAAQKMTLVILYEKKVRLLDGQFAKRDKPDLHGEWWDYTWDKEPRDLAAARFHAPFVAYRADKAYYFLTQFGECHGVRDDGKGGRETAALWAREDQPIARLITDTGTGKTFAFTLPLERKDGSRARPGYFELGPKPELVEYDPAKVRKNDFPYPYKQIRECVDVLLADKKIDPAQHRPKDKK